MITGNLSKEGFIVAMVGDEYDCCVVLRKDAERGVLACGEKCARVAGICLALFCVLPSVVFVLLMCLDGSK